MEKEEIINALVLLYHRRLKALLGYQDESSTRELVKLMFDCAAEIEITENKQRCYKEQTLTDIAKVLQCNPNDKLSLLEGKNAINDLTLRLEGYYMYVMHRFWPETRENQPDDCRAFLGKRFNEATLSWTKERNNSPIVKIQIRASHIRNEKAHLRADYTSKCHRYSLLCVYDILLTYLLYTFYYQTFAECEQNKLKEELHENK